MSGGGIRRGVVLAVVAAGCLAWQPLSAVAGSGARVDLNIGYDEPEIDAGGTGTQTVTVTNAGVDATGPAELTVTTPVFVAVTALPRNCAFLYQDGDAGDATVPDVLRCTLPPLDHDESVTVTFRLAVDANAAAGVTFGEATVLPAPGSADVDQNLADNLGWPSVLVTGAAPVRGGPSTGHVTDLFVTTDLPALAVGAPAPETLTVGNRGPQATTGPARLLLVTPPLVRAADPLPAGCGFRYDSPDPAAPQVIGCSIDAPLASGATAVVRVPLTVLFGSPVQTSWGLADVFPDRAAGSTDVDPVPANNVVETGVQVVG